MNVRGVRAFAMIGIVMLALLLYRFWFGESGWFAVQSLAAEVAAQERRTQALAESNGIVIAEVMALKDGHRAVEARARTDLGMIGVGETFYLVVDADALEPR